MADGHSGYVSVVKDLLLVVRRLPAVELQRRRVGLHRAVELARREGVGGPVRSPEARVRLRRLINAVDRRLPGGGNCVRRALLEISLDGDFARERLFAGLRSGGGPKSGHAWLESNSHDGVYDAVITI